MYYQAAIGCILLSIMSYVANLTQDKKTFLWHCAGVMGSLWAMAGLISFAIWAFGEFIKP